MISSGCSNGFPPSVTCTQSWQYHQYLFWSNEEEIEFGTNCEGVKKYRINNKTNLIPLGRCLSSGTAGPKALSSLVLLDTY